MSMNTVSIEQMECTRNKSKERTTMLPDHVNKATEWMNELFFVFLRFLKFPMNEAYQWLNIYLWTTSRTCLADALQKLGLNP